MTASTACAYGVTYGFIPRRGHLCDDLLAAVVVIVVGSVVGSVVMSRPEETVLGRSETIAVQISSVIIH